jgi:serine/threonine-protein kinase
MAQDTRAAGDLGLRTPISDPPCDGRTIVVLGNITTPGMYPAGVQGLLDAHPGAYYLRTDQSCPSLRQASDEGNPIYTVFEFAGRSEPEACAGVRAAGGGSYGKWLDYTHNPADPIPC